MKRPLRTLFATLTGSILALGCVLAQTESAPKDAKAADQGAKATDEASKAPKIDPAQFTAKLQRDDTEIPNAGQLHMTYAPVVEKILPSVVTIFSSGSSSETTPDMEDIPPQLRPFFYRFFGNPFEENEEGAEEAPAPRRRGGGGGGATPAPRQRPSPPTQRGVGSGFILSKDGYIMTNNHVVADADKIEVAVEINGKSRTYTAKVIGTDPLSDVALIKVDATDLPQATLGDSSKIKVGDIVLAAGAPMELNRSITQGIVSALGRSGMNIVGRGKVAGYEDFIQTDASINPGNSGGPLVDSMGRVVGINTAILSRSGMNAGIGFAIPINMALHIVEDLIDDGQVQRGFLGVAIEDLKEDQATALGLKEVGGALVKTVNGGSPAAKAGLEVGDVVIGINGQRIETSAKLRLVVSNYRPGTEISMDVVRDGNPMTLKATLAALPNDLAGITPSREGSSGAAGGTGEIVPGVSVQNLTPAVRERYDIPAEINGVVVTKLDPESRAASMGVEEGDVITAINRKPVKNLSEAREMSKSSEKTAVLLKVYRKGDSMLFMVGTTE
jgi:serine protease Do